MAKLKTASTNKSHLAAMPEAESLPSFDEKALFALTEKIEKGFGKDKSRPHPGEIPSRNHTRDSKTSRPIDSDIKTSKKLRPPEKGGGTKRDAQGNMKLGDNHRKAKNQKPRREQDIGATLMQEILALGGTEDDFNLVADAPSDEENFDAHNSDHQDKSLQKDLARFVADLGIEGTIREDVEAELEGTDSGEEVENGQEEASKSIPSDESEGVNDFSDALKKPATDPKDSESSSSRDLNRLIFDPRPDWHAAPFTDLSKSTLVDPARFRSITSNLKDYAVSLLESDSNLYASKHLASSSSHRFLSTIMSSGTLSDKVSALTLVVQESPVHTTKSFESLLTLARKRSRGQAVTALGALKDLLAVGVVLPADRRLRSFDAQPGLLGALEESSITSWKSGNKLPGGITKAHLVAWVYEDWLKESYFDMLKVLESWCNDEVEYARSRAVTYVYELLKEKPEQESNLLRLLVNKLGDPDKKIASRTSYLLLQLQISHPVMKPIIIRSIESELLLRPGQSLHAKYYAINTLNQTILSGKEEDVAKKLLGIYFDLFVTLLKKPAPQIASTGPLINRKGQVQGGGGPMGKKAKAKASKEELAQKASEETIEKMISAVLTGVNRAFPFVESDDLTLETHMDTLFRITHSSNFNTSIQALMLIEQLASTKHLEVDRFYRTLYESLLDHRLINSSKHALYLNLMFRALKSDLNMKRVKAFAKRMMQVLTLHQPPFVCGVIFLLRELESVFPGLKSLLNDPEANEEDEDDLGDASENVLANGSLDSAIRSFQIQKSAKISKSYDGRKRDPEHTNANKSCLWESIPFLAHFHPSVAMFASHLLSEKKMPPKPDLASHTLTHFLDRFVYRNAKAASGPRGSSIMQPLSGGDSRGNLLSGRNKQNGQEPVNSEAFWRKKAEDIAVDEVFFHKYFGQIGKAKQASSNKKGISQHVRYPGSEDEEYEAEIWQALVDSRPEVEGGSDDDSDLEMLDKEDSDALSASDYDILEEDWEDAGSEEQILSGEDNAAEDDDDGDVPTELDGLFSDELQLGKNAAGEQEEESSKRKRRKLKNLPTFASADDYAKMLENDEDENL